AADAVVRRLRAAPQARQLREHEPYPVAALEPVADLAERAFEHALLRLDVSFQPLGHAPAPGRIWCHQAIGWPRLVRHFDGAARRSEEHTSELQSRENLVCRLLLEKKKKTNNAQPTQTL